MPYSFVQIEQSKSRTIQWAMFFLILLYLLGALVIVGAVKFFLFSTSIETAFYLRNSFFYLIDGPTFLITIIGALVFSLIHWFVATDALIDKTLQYMSGRVADPQNDNERVFCNIVEEVSVATGGKYRIEPFIIPTAALNAFALQDFQGRSVIGVTDGLMKKLNRAQLEAVIAHEAGHIASGDCLETTVTSVVFKAFDALCDMSRRMLFYGSLTRNDRDSERRGGGGQIVLLALVVFCVSILLKFIGYMGSLFVSRQREYRADALSVQLTRNPLALAEALHIIDQRWKGSGIPGETMDAIFILSPRKNAVEENEGFFSDLFSTHPPISKRVGILLEMAHAKAADLDIALKRVIERSNQEQTGAINDPVSRNVSGFPIPVPLPIPLPTALGVSGVPAGKDQCPRCAVGLGVDEHVGVTVQKCASCHGVLVSEQHVLRIVSVRGVQFESRIADLARITRQQVQVLQSNPFDRIYDRKSIVCPSCLDEQQRMTRRFVSSRYPIEIDKCRTCSRVWFDKDELEVLQCLYEFDHANGKA